MDYIHAAVRHQAAVMFVDTFRRRCGMHLYISADIRLIVRKREVHRI